MRLADESLPAEEYWGWRGHQVHLDRLERASSPVTVILLHGVGTNGRQLSLIAGAPLWRRGLATVALDLPSYGQTRVAPGARVTYDDWVRLVCDFIDAERRRAGRPVVLYGLSAGGMLAYHAAAIDRQVAGIVGMTFLDQRAQLVRDATALNLLMSRVGGSFAALAAATPLGGLKLPMRLASKMHTLVNDPAALRVFLADRSSAGNWATLRFLDSYLRYQPAIEPEDFAVCPILLTQPAEDRWTPLALSELVLRRVRRVPVTRVLLECAGHYPLEQPGLAQMAEAIVAFVGGLPGV
ncbi:MAG: alpha/beta fold hydrolase [Chloroflexales bacterium]|nr:alpha/beta fold hydrolase [Chloroflexales bacterium]